MGWVDTDGVPSVLAEGKRLRPTLCLLACEAAGGMRRRAMPAAVALEFIHNFSLIHDDIEDGDRIRHHRPTLWAVWGEPTAIVSGNVLITLADITIQSLVEHGVSKLIACEAAETLTLHYLRMMEGQYQDIQFESRSNVTVDEYLQMIERKTGALIECSVYLGALVGPDRRPDRALAQKLRHVGYELGRIFQIRDDILGIWGGAATGKPVGSDIQRKKKSLPVIHAINESKGRTSRLLSEIFSKSSISKSDVDCVLDVMEELDTRNYCQNLAAERWELGKSVIESLRLNSQSASDFMELGDFLLVRES